MVSPFTLGLFAPLPLAMMIPFMATQSLAMGEAFGKSFQFGKRKISSMTNEEFNKLTIQDIMNEQTANIKSLIPALAQQMADSNVMQKQVFQEMTKLIPAFIKGLSAGTKDIIDENKLDLSNVLPAPAGLAGAIAQRVIIDINVQNNTQGEKIQQWFEADASSGNNQKFKQADYGITENFGKQSDIPITLTSLSDAQIKDAYSDMLSNRITLSTKNKQLLTVEYKKRFGGSIKATKQVATNQLNTLLAKPATTLTQAHADWQKIKVQFMQNVLTAKSLWMKIVNSSAFHDTSGQQAAFLQKKPYTHQLDSFKNWISFHRNNTNHLIKVEARQDWNNQIWKKL